MPKGVGEDGNTAWSERSLNRSSSFRFSRPLTRLLLALSHCCQRHHRAPSESGMLCQLRPARDARRAHVQSELDSSETSPFSGHRALAQRGCQERKRRCKDQL